MNRNQGNLIRPTNSSNNVVRPNTARPVVRPVSPTSGNSIAPRNPTISTSNSIKSNNIARPNTYQNVDNNKSKNVKTKSFVKKDFLKNLTSRSEIFFYIGLFFTIFGISVLVSLAIKDAYTEMTTATKALIATSSVAMVGGITSLLFSYFLNKKSKNIDREALPRRNEKVQSTQNRGLPVNRQSIPATSNRPTQTLTRTPTVVPSRPMSNNPNARIATPVRPTMGASSNTRVSKPIIK